MNGHSKLARVASLLLTLALAWTLLAGPAAAQGVAAPAAAPPGQAVSAQFVRELAGIEEYRLPNGLQILLFPDASSTTTTVNITYRVGSRHEGAGEYGMAHLLEHLVFKGTPTYRDITGEFARRAMRWNGTTSGDRTNYFATFNANEETLAFALALEADRMVNSLIAKEDLDKEMPVVRNEFERADSNPLQVLSQRVMGTAYHWHPYGRATIGVRSDIENVPIERLRAFYKRHYRPDNATLLVAGRFDKARVLQTVVRTFGPLVQPAEPLQQPYTAEPAQDGERTVVVRRVGGQPALIAHYHVPAAAHPDTAALVVYQLLMSMRPSGQLYRKLVETKLAVAAGLGGGGGAAPGGVTAVAILQADSKVEEVEKLLLDLVEGRGAEPFQPSEFERVRELAQTAYREQMKSPEGLAQGISNVVASGDWRLQFQLIEDIPRVTLADVERVRQAYFRPANRTLGRYLPAAAAERVQIPAAPPIVERLAGLKGPPRVEEGEQLDPTPANLESRTVRTRLPSGIGLQTLRKSLRGQTVHLQMSLRWGSQEQTFPIRGTDMVASLLFEGSQRYSKQQLQDELLRLRASLNVSSGDQGATVSLTAERDTLLPALRIAADMLRNPLLPAEAFERMQRAAISGLQSSRQELGTVRVEATRAHYNAALGASFGQPDYVKSLDDRIHGVQSTTLEAVRAMHRDWWSANEARVAVAGSLPEGLGEEIDRLFGDWKKPAAGRFVRHEPRHYVLPPGRFIARAADKSNAVLRWHQTFPLNQDHPDFVPLLVGVRIFGGGGLESRLASRVRVKEGLSYSIGSGLGVPQHGDRAGLSIDASFSPDQRERVIQAVREELIRYAEAGPTEAEVVRARQDLLAQRRESRGNDGGLPGLLLSLDDLGETFDASRKRDEAIASVTREQVLAAWRRHVRSEGFVVSAAGDFKE
jgi:zinc protease